MGKHNLGPFNILVLIAVHEPIVPKHFSYFGCATAPVTLFIGIQNLIDPHPRCAWYT